MCNRLTARANRPLSDLHGRGQHVERVEKANTSGTEEKAEKHSLQTRRNTN